MENIPTGDMPDLPLSPIEKSSDQRAAEDAALEEVRSVAAMPGWPTIKKQMESDAEDLLRHKGLEFNSSTPDAELGRKVRDQLLLAQWIQQYIERIDNAVKAVEQVDKERANENASGDENVAA